MSLHTDYLKINKSKIINSQKNWINWEYCKNCKYAYQEHLFMAVYEFKCKLNLNKGQKIKNCKRKEFSFLYKLFNRSKTNAKCKRIRKNIKIRS